MLGPCSHWSRQPAALIRILRPRPWRATAAFRASRIASPFLAEQHPRGWPFRADVGCKRTRAFRRRAWFGSLVLGLIIEADWHGFQGRALHFR